MSSRMMEEVQEQVVGPRTSARGAKISIKSKVWIEDQDGNVVFGSGRLQILNAIHVHGSILAAAKELGMSYRAVWGKIKATESSLGEPLLARRTGGAHGGGSELTPLGKDLLERYQKLQSLIETTANTLFQGLFNEHVSEHRSTVTKDG